MMTRTVPWMTAIILTTVSLRALGQEDTAQEPSAKDEPAGAEEKQATVPETEGARLLRYPDIHDDKVAFVYGGDLWLAASAGGVARRLTSHPGPELFPTFSPDGKSIAFSATYDGNMDIYVIPSEGGEPQRLTWHPSPDLAVGWTPDGARVLFFSPRLSPTGRDTRLFTVSVKGGLAEVLPMDEAGLGSFSPDGGRIAYNRIAMQDHTWKRYKGGMAQDIWIYDLKGNTVERITDYVGGDDHPMWSGNKIYFVSDREHFANLYSYDLESKETKKLTDQKEFDVKWPSLGPGAIVYEDGGFLHVLDLATEQTKKLSIELPYDWAAIRPAYDQVESFISEFDISPSGKFGLFSARGDLFTISASQGNVRNLTSTNGVRERNAVWSPDGKSVAYLSDKTGEYEIYTRAADGTPTETQVTKDGTCFKFQPVWSPDSTKLAFADKTRTLYYADVQKKNVIPIDRGEWVGLMSYFDRKWEGIDDYAWSPDSQWIVYSKTEPSYFKSIFLYSLEEGRVYRVTSSMTDDSYPTFDKNGKYLYFVSRRTFLPSFDMFDRTTYTYTNSERIYLVTLQKDLPSPFEPEADDKEPVKSEGPPQAPGQQGRPEAAQGQPGAPPAKPGFRIDVEGFEARTLALPVPPGNYSNLAAAKDRLFYISSPSSGSLLEASNPMASSLCCFDMGSKRSTTMMPGVTSYALAAGDGHIIYSAMGQYGIIAATPSSFPPGTGKLAINRLEMKIDYRAEWQQIFAEAWRLERDFFYDPAMHGTDWNKMKERYGKLIPHLSSRSDLNYVLGELIGELCAGHTYVGGGDSPRVSGTPVGLLGTDFLADPASGTYRFAKIYAGQKMDPSLQGPLAKPGAEVEAGEYLLAVNGKPVKISDNPYRFFENTVGKQVEITVNRRPSMDSSRKIIVTPTGSESELRYYDWVEGNRRKVEEASQGRIGYIHLPDTSIDGLIEFSKGFFTYYRREGLIIDERYNGGGLIPDIFMERLRRELVCYFHPRGAADNSVPSIIPPPHMACITNAYAGSGGDAFPYYFREYGLGPLIGMRTWGGLIGIPRILPLVDKGMVTAPEFGIFDLQGNWVVENHGVDPDIEVDNRPDLVAAGHDPQLEKAIEVVLEAIRKEPKKEVKRAPFPIRN
ncbi:MAG: PDZ domain-containing protein [Planctomycetota bacterium]